MTQDLIDQLRAIDEAAMYEAPATTYALVNEAADLIEALTEALEKIREGSIARPLGKHWRADCAPSKHDRCIHEKAMWEDCPQCIDEHIHIALAGNDRIAARAALHIRDGE